jgi:phosphoribosyl 1,2-cyclic phosphodiesterase
MRFASLGSGSQGNALVVEAGETKVLLDCGFATKTAIERLQRLDMTPDQLDAVLVTHEHSDHLSGVFRFARRHDLPVYLTHGTFTVAARSNPPLPKVCLIDSHTAFTLGALDIQPFPVPHDAREPVQYVFSSGCRRLGVLTDTGAITAHIVEVLRECDALVLECNHDPALLAASAYPAMLKKRISGRLGHLDNGTAASLLQQIDTRRLQHLVAAHLSQQNNRPNLAVSALASVLNCAEEWICVADQENGFGWRKII